MAASGPPGEGAPTTQHEALVKVTAASPDPKGKGSGASATPDPNSEGSGVSALPDPNGEGSGISAPEAWGPQGPHEVTGHVRGWTSGIKIGKDVQ
jgi:hypothetical protein